MSRPVNPSKVALGRVIQNGREAAKLTQEDLAIAVGATQQTISRWESGQMIPGIEKLPKLAQVLKVELSALTEAAVQQAVDTPPSTMPTRFDNVEGRLTRLETLVEAIASQLGVAVDGSSPAPRRRAPLRRAR